MQTRAQLAGGVVLFATAHHKNSAGLRKHSQGIDVVDSGRNLGDAVDYLELLGDRDDALGGVPLPLIASPEEVQAETLVLFWTSRLQQADGAQERAKRLHSQRQQGSNVAEMKVSVHRIEVLVCRCFVA